MESNQTEQKQEKRIMQNENRLKELSENIKHKICITGVPEEEGEKRAEERFKETIAENVPHLKKNVYIWIHKA